MIIYDFIEQRLDQLECNDGWNAAQYMVDGLWDKNYLTFRQNDPIVNDICTELCQELDDVTF